MRPRLLALLLSCLGLLASGRSARAERDPLVASGLDDDDGPPSKKERTLLDKAGRLDRRAREPPRAGQPPAAVLTLKNVWTHESLPVAPARMGPPPKTSAPAPLAPFCELTRCHFTNQSTAMDGRLLQVVLSAAAKFRSSTVEIVSGFRAPKYQLMLRKKGHEVARDSQHPLGHAVDFRIPEVPTKVLLRFVRSLKLGGVGYYPDSHFVHADVGRVRYWRGH